MTTIPIDVLLHIIGFTDHPKDLLSLALTARASHAAIVPRHIDYRRISITCTESSEHVWKHLLDTPHACSRIRYLILLSHRRTEIPRMCRIASATRPRIFSGDDNLLNVISDTFIQALSNMVNLKVLKFKVTDGGDEELCEAIGRAGCDLEELEVHFELPNTAIKQRFEKGKVSKHSETFSLFYDYLPSLRKYTIKSRTQYDGGIFLQILLNTPNLTYMNVASSLPSAFFSGYWPNLQRLKFHNYVSNLSNPIVGKDYLPSLRTFLHRHSRLIALSAYDVLLPGWAIESDDFLPNLKSFYIKLTFASTSITTNIATRLTHLKMNNDLYCYLTKRGIILSNLETCMYWNAHLQVSTTRDLIQNLVVMAPNVQKLYLTFGLVRDGCGSNSNTEYRLLTLDEIMEHVPLFTSLKNLRVLLGPFDDISVENFLPFKILYNFPRLLYTRIVLGNDGLKIIRLERDDIAKVMRYERAEVLPDECDLFSWDGIYRHDDISA